MSLLRQESLHFFISGWNWFGKTEFKGDEKENEKKIIWSLFWHFLLSHAKLSRGKRSELVQENEWICDLTDKRLSQASYNKKTAFLWQ